MKTTTPALGRRIAALEARRPAIEAIPDDLPANERYMRMVRQPGECPPADTRQISKAEAEATYQQIMGAE